LAQPLHNGIRKVAELQQEVIDNAENILDVINVEQLVKNPKEYLTRLGLEFLNEHIDEIEQGADQGKKMAEDILNG
tara:strand:+ start:361 stop:588 length:228 start_codon:yes stop_codon:yes gene_type:complete